MFIFTGEILHKICPSIKIDRANLIADLHVKVCPLYKINTADIFHEFLANELEESGQFSIFTENLYYTTAKQLCNVWPSRFPTLESAQPYLRNPMKLAQKVYDGRADLGNTKPGDGWLLRGSGPMQITGRKNITDFTNHYNNMFNTTYTPVEMAERLRTDLEIGIHGACWVFAIAKNLIQLAIDDNLKAIVKKINGGYTGLVSRTAFYNLAKKYIVEA